MEEQFEWPLAGRPKIKAERDGWTVSATAGGVFSETVVADLIRTLPQAAARFGTLLVELPGYVEHYERLGALMIRVHGNRDGISVNGIPIDLGVIPDLIEALEQAVVRGDELVGRIRRGETADLAPKVTAAWPPPSLPRPRIPLSAGAAAL